MSFEVIMAIIGAAILLVTAWNVLTGEPTLMLFWDSWRALKITRQKHPWIFWLVIAVQASVGFAFLGWDRALDWLPFV